MKTPTSLSEGLVVYMDRRLANRSPSTRKHHEQELERWRTWIVSQTQPNVRLADIDTDLQSRYFARLRPPAMRESSFNNYRQYNMAFWQFCVAEGWVRLNPTRYIDPYDVPKRQHLRLSAEELEELLRLTDVHNEPRDRILFVTGINTGLRNQDLSALTIGDAELHDDLLNAYIQKTRKTDSFPIGPDFRDEMMRWFDSYAGMLGVTVRDLRNSYTLIPPFAGRPVVGGGSRREVMVNKHLVHPQQLLHPYLAEMGFELSNPDSPYDHKSNNLGLHTLRRSAARVLMDEAAARGHKNPIRVAQVFLGHQSQKVTENYVGVDLDRTDRDDILKDGFLSQAAERQRAAHTADTSRNDLRRRRSA